MQHKIIQFLNSMHLMTLSVNCNNLAYTCSAFYAFDDKNLELIIASNTDTNHIKAIKNNNLVGVCIAKDTKKIVQIQGVQIIGKMLKADKKSAQIYYKKFPFAIAHPSPLFTIEILWLKFTDNKLGIGKKIVWKKENFNLEI